MSQIRKCSANEAHQALLSDPNCQVVDVREFSEFESRRVGGTAHAPLSEFSKHAKQVDPKRNIYVLCQSGSRATKATEQLVGLGYPNVAIIDGGLNAWQALGLPTEMGSGKVWAMERQVRFTAGMLVLAGMLLGWLVHSNWFFLSALVGGGLVFSAATDTCTMAMILAKFPWNRKGAPSCTSNNSI